MSISKLTAHQIVPTFVPFLVPASHNSDEAEEHCTLDSTCSVQGQKEVSLTLF